MPEPSVLPISTGEAALPWRRFVAERVPARFHPRLRRAISASISRPADEPPLLIELLGPAGSGRTTLLRVVQRTVLACGAMSRVAVKDSDGVLHGPADAGVCWTTEPCSDGTTKIEVRLASPVALPEPDFHSRVGTLEVLTWVGEKGSTRG